ncbi:hypothetical protein HQ447_11620 [bacterium]|nr:hypothetical protein [bacterium]
MRFSLIIIMFGWLAVGTAGAHLGLENTTEVRIFSNEMRLIVRTSIPFAWALLRERAPASADEAGQAIARPLLIEAAPGLFTVTAGGELLTPLKTDCLFEVEKDVAFILTFERPRQWPVVLEARFLPLLTSVDTGTITVYDYTASRFSRDLEPLLRATLDTRNPSVSFRLPAAAVSPAVVATPNPPRPHGRAWIGICLLLSAVAAIGFLVWRRWRGIDEGS